MTVDGIIPILWSRPDGCVRPRCLLANTEFRILDCHPEFRTRFPRVFPSTEEEQECRRWCPGSSDGGRSRVRGMTTPARSSIPERPRTGSWPPRPEIRPESHPAFVPRGSVSAPSSGRHVNRSSAFVRAPTIRATIRSWIERGTIRLNTFITRAPDGDSTQNDRRALLREHPSRRGMDEALRPRIRAGKTDSGRHAPSRSVSGMYSTCRIRGGTRGRTHARAPAIDRAHRPP